MFIPQIVADVKPVVMTAKKRIFVAFLMLPVLYVTVYMSSFNTCTCQHQTQRGTEFNGHFPKEVPSNLEILNHHDRNVHSETPIENPIILSARTIRELSEPEKEKYSRDLGDWMQQKLSSLQNPANCSSAQKLVCELRHCGAACQIQHVSYCLIIALATDRTLILSSSAARNWTYNKGFFKNT